MNRYPELLRMPESAERFYNEFKEILPQEKFFTEFSFVNNCDDFQWAFNKYLIQDKASLYKTHSLIRSYFYDNKDHINRLTLFAVFVKEHMETTEARLLDYEYYELMRKFLDGREKVNTLISMLISDSFEQPMLVE
jgi:hypothetical protein